MENKMMLTPLALRGLLLISLLSFLCISASHAASFDCAKAMSKVERLICSHDELSKLDDELALAYREAKKTAADLESNKRSQQAWLKARNACLDGPCLNATYTQRIAQLKAGDGTNASPPVRAAANSAAGETANLCDQFRRLLDVRSPNGIGQYALESSIPIGGQEVDARYFNIDIDGDGIDDLVTVSCPSSNETGDPCGLWIELSSGKKIEFEEDRFYLVRYHSKVYAVANHGGANVNVGKRKIYYVDKSGVKLICSNL